MRQNGRRIFTVTELNKHVKDMFAQDYLLQAMFVKGEVSNCRYHSSGHIYFTLKEATATVECVMYCRDRDAGLDFQLQNGQQVVIGGRVDLYVQGGKYQVIAKHIVLEGAGAVYERLQRLKAELAALGMFDPSHKKKVPRLIRTLGIVSGSVGNSAASNDIIQNALRRNPYVQIVICPVIVQGQSAPESIARGIQALERQNVDVIIVGRGGGSTEDLWAFNERVVAQATFDCTVPIISAVGHSIDATIIDLVADLVAITPTQAAEFAVADISEIMGDMQSYAERMSLLMQRRIRSERADLDRMGEKMKLLMEREVSSERAGLEQMKLKMNFLMRQKLSSGRADLEQMRVRLKHYSPINRVKENRQRSVQFGELFQKHMNRILTDRRHALDLYIEKMKGLSPLEKLKSGFSYVEDEEGVNIRSVRQVQPEGKLTVRVSDGKIYTQVIGTEEETELMRDGN